MARRDVAPAELVDLDRLPPRVGAGARVGILDAPDPEIDDRADAEELLPAGVAEVLARLLRDDAIHHPAAALTKPGRALEAREPCLELGDSHLRLGHRHTRGRHAAASSRAAAA